jgi:hypothetical protein
MQYPSSTQQASLKAKLEGKPFLKEISRQGQQYWWKSFRKRARETGNWADLRQFYDESLATGQIAVTNRRIYRASRFKLLPPYLPFALTINLRPFSLE